MKQYQFKNNQEYVEAQISANVAKIDRNWVHEAELGIIANFIILEFGRPEFVICHGARNGFEVETLGKYFGRDLTIIGTDISPTANKIPDMLQWDFHEINPKWAGLADLVYCNSLDHSYDMRKAVTAWMDSLKPRGIIVVHWTEGHEKGDVKPSDCFHASDREYEKILSKCGTVLCKNRIEILKGGYYFVVMKKS